MIQKTYCFKSNLGHNFIHGFIGATQSYINAKIQEMRQYMSKIHNAEFTFKEVTWNRQLKIWEDI